MEQDQVINCFVEFLSRKKDVRLIVDSYPDKINRSSKEIDAIIQGGEFKIALEHTSIDTIPNQREDSDRFMKIFGEIEDNLKNNFDSDIELSIECYVIPTGINWSMLKENISSWLLSSIPQLECGVNYCDVPDVPFKICIIKQKSSNPIFTVRRSKPNDETLPERLDELIQRKAKKLIPYKSENYITMLLIENADIALMSNGKMIESFDVIQQRMKHIDIDEIWFADTSMGFVASFVQLWPGVS